MAPSGPYRLVTVNTAPDRAKRLIGRVVEDVKDTYTLVHVGNAASMCPPSYLTSPLYISLPSSPSICLTHTFYQTPGIEEVRQAVEDNQPDLLVRLVFSVKFSLIPALDIQNQSTTSVT